MKKPKVSVVIPCYNDGRFILDALQSIQNQSFKDFECVIIDDGSEDNTNQIVLEWIKKDQRFQYVYQENSGVSRARNYGISLCCSDYILPLDADDKISYNYISECYNAIINDSKISIVYGNAFNWDSTYKKWNLNQYNFEDLLFKNMIFCTALFKKSDWLEVGGYDENLIEGLEDWELWINILKAGGLVVKLDTCSFYYRKKEFSITSELVIKNAYGYNSRLYIFEKHIKLYRKTNFYDMYFENYKLKKNAENPLLSLSIRDLILLIIKFVAFKVEMLIRKISRISNLYKSI